MDEEQKLNKNKSIIIVAVISLLILTLGGSLALWTYFKVGSNQQLIAGDIYMKYTGVNNLSIKNAMPSLTYEKNNYFEFNIVGKNTHKEDIIYEIVLDRGDESEDENRTIRIKDELLKFRLVEVKDDLEEELIQEGSYDELVKRRIWVDRVKAGTKEEETHTYRLYMWVSIDTKIGNVGQDYTLEQWEKVFASVKITVNGDLKEKELTEDYMILNAVNESGEPYDLKQPIESDEDITLTLGSKREVTKFVVSKSSEYPIALMKLEEPADYEASYNEVTRAWEAKVTIDETGIYDYYAVYPEGKGQSKKYSFSVLFNPDRFVKVEKPTSALCKQGLTYTGSPQDLIAEENLDREGYTIEQVQGTDANSYEITAKLKEKFRWKDSSQEDATFNCTIGPKETILSYTPSSLSVYKGAKKTFTIVSNNSGIFEISSNSSNIATLTFEPLSGTSTTVILNGINIGNTNLDVKFIPSNNNYTKKSDTYTVQVINPPLAITKLKETIGQERGMIGVTTSNTKTTTKDASNIREYRYSGADVDNYIYFNCGDEKEQNDDNCEKWRIIGIFKDGENELIKITSGKIAKTMVWNSFYRNWSSSQISTYLNGEYYNSLSTRSKNMIASAKYYLGSVANAMGDSYYNAVNLYSNERNGSTWTGKIAILYPSDFGFSSDSTNWKNSLLIYGPGSDTSWLHYDTNHGSCWLLAYWGTDRSYDGYEVVTYWNDYGAGITWQEVKSSSSLPVVPTLYLKSEVTIIDGDGTSEKPYQLLEN